MPVTLQVKAELNDAAKCFPTLWKQIPRYAASSLNETAAFVRKNAVNNIALRLKLPRRVVSKRIALDGSAKGDRIKLRRATPGNLTAVLDTHARGIPVTNVQGAQTRPRGGGGGVKGKGGRFYQGAFKARRQVFERTSAAKDAKLMVPKIGVREQIDKEMQAQFAGPGKSEFKRRLERRLQFELTR